MLHKTRQFTDIIHGVILYSDLEGIIINTPIFNRLHRILQSSLVYLTYSSNKVKRFEHSIGTMQLAGEIFYNSFVNTKDKNIIEDLLFEFKKEIKDWFLSYNFRTEKMISNAIKDQINLENIFNTKFPNNELYKRYLPNDINDEDIFPYLVVFQSIRLAALLHDVGHLPYSHIFENSVKTLYSKVDRLENNNKAQQSFLDIMKDYNTGDKELHEEIGYKLLTQIKDEIEDFFEENEENFFVVVVYEFTKKILSSTDEKNNIFSDLHRIISGILDADRLDYCTRDLYCSGVDKDIFPYQRLLANYCIKRFQSPMETEDDSRLRFVFSPAMKNILEIDDLLKRRWTIFSQINYHHRVHKHEIIFSEILASIAFEELEKLNNEDIPMLPVGALPLKVTSIWALVKMLSDNNLAIDYLIIQLDDSWMDTLLKNAFFVKYSTNFRNIKKHKSDSSWNMFDELISTKKHYYSLYKRKSNYSNFDKEFFDKWQNKIEKLDALATEKIRKEITLLKIFIKKFNEINDSLNAFNVLLSLCISTKNYVQYYQEVEEKVNDILSKNDLGIYHCLIKSCEFSLGCFNTGFPIMLWSDEAFMKYENISLMPRILKILKQNYPSFHIYYLPSRKLSREDIEKFESYIIGTMIEVMLDFFIKQVDKKMN